jgi:hypothetical protein
MVVVSIALTVEPMVSAPDDVLGGADEHAAVATKRTGTRREGRPRRSMTSL